jgi:hypothetical protein
MILRSWSGLATTGGADAHVARIFAEREWVFPLTAHAGAILPAPGPQLEAMMGGRP